MNGRQHNYYINLHYSFPLYSMCSLVVSVLDSPAVDPRSNPGSGSALLTSEKSQAVYSILHLQLSSALQGQAKLSLVRG